MNLEHVVLAMRQSLKPMFRIVSRKINKIYSTSLIYSQKQQRELKTVAEEVLKFFIYQLMHHLNTKESFTI